MFCKNCGREVPEDTKFCPFCGVKIEQAKTSYLKSSSSSTGILNLLIQIMAFVSIFVSIVILIGTLIIRGRISNFANVSQITAFANNLGLSSTDLQNPVFLQIVQVLRNITSGISRAVMFGGMILFIILFIIGITALTAVLIKKKLDSLE